ncbi:MAG: TVP38/TMEM64 family protein [Candidatus Kerfeldbacteria bacterium]|nr:TVP38/TMEM64 family protein [Candidatus Kerfeldbacteria bacterium]
MRLKTFLRSVFFRRKQHPRWPAFALLGILVASGILLLIPSVRELLISPTVLRDRVATFGPWGPVALFVYHVLQIVVAPLPGQPVDIVYGYLFGPALGSVLAVAGVFVGTVVAIGLSRTYGHPLVHAFIAERNARKLERAVSHRSVWFFLVAFLIPGAPVDILCLVLGLTRVPYWQAVLVANLGRLPVTVGGVLIGATGHSWNPMTLALIAVLIFVTSVLVVQILPRRWRVVR